MWATILCLICSSSYRNVEVDNRFEFRDKETVNKGQQRNARVQGEATTNDPVLRVKRTAPFKIDAKTLSIPWA